MTAISDVTQGMHLAGRRAAIRRAKRRSDWNRDFFLNGLALPTTCNYQVDVSSVDDLANGKRTYLCTEPGCPCQDDA